MLESISSVFGSAKIATEMIKTIRDMAKDGALKDKVVELYDVILALQQRLLRANIEIQTLVDVKERLEKKIMEYERWEHEKRKHKLEEVSPGVFVFMRKPEVQPAAPAPWLCQNCFHKKQISILQLIKKNVRGSFYVCHNCHAEIHLPSDWKPPRQPAPVY